MSDAHKGMPVEFEIQIPIWNVSVSVVRDVDAYGRWCTEVFKDETEEWMDHRAGFSMRVTNGRYTYFVMGIRPKREITTLVHEALHVSWKILDELGIKVSEDNAEPLTYLQEYIVNEFYAHYERRVPRV